MTMNDQDLKKKLGELTNTLDSMFAELRKSQPSKDVLTKGLVSVKTGLINIQNAISDPGESDLTDFFTGLGKGLIETQRELDRQSTEYLREIRSKPHILPSIFRAPKLSGKLNVGLQKRKGSGFNLLIAARKEEAEEFQHQEINFELASVPPPQEAIQKIMDPIEGWDLILGPHKRASVCAVVEKCLDPGNPSFTHSGTPAGRQRAIQAFQVTQHDRVLMLLANKPTQIMMAALFPFQAQGTQAPSDYLEIWELTVPESENEQPAMSSLFFSNKPGELKKVLKPLIDQQEQFLKGLEGKTQ